MTHFTGGLTAVFSLLLIFRVARQLGLSQSLAITFKTLSVGHESKCIFQIVAYESDPAMAQFDQVARRHLTAKGVVNNDLMHFCVLDVDQYNRDLRVSELTDVEICHRQTDDEDAVHARMARQVVKIPLTLRNSLDVEQYQIVFTFGQGVLNALQAF